MIRKATMLNPKKMPKRCLPLDRSPPLSFIHSKVFLTTLVFSVAFATTLRPGEYAELKFGNFNFSACRNTKCGQVTIQTTLWW